MDNKTREIIEAMDKHADELEARDERHVYGTARIHMMLLDEKIAELEERIEKIKDRVVTLKSNAYGFPKGLIDRDEIDKG